MRIQAAIAGVRSTEQSTFIYWICMDMKECVWDYIHLTDEKILGSHVWKGKLDLFNIVMIGLPKKLPEKGEQYELHRLLTALLSMELPVKEKQKIISDEYGISTGSDTGKETDDMCNLGLGVLELGYEKGVVQCRREMIFNMHRAGLPVSQIAEIAGLSEDEICLMIDEAEELSTTDK